MAFLKSITDKTSALYAARIQGQKKNKLLKYLVFLIALFLMVVQSVSAEIAINFTDLGTLITGIASLMPSINELIVAIVPTIFLIAVCGFIFGILAAILMGLTGAFKNMSFMKMGK
ncbi:MAG: hypothetical protein WC683_15680 [bacterium]